MTKKNIINFLLIASYAAITFFIGCIPEDSLQWSTDGSKGIYSKNGALFLVDGNTGALTSIAPRETTTHWPAISPDSSLFAYGQIVKVNDFNKSFELLPPVEVKKIKAHADTLGQKIIAEGIKDGNLPALENYSNEQHTAWVNRYLIEKADRQLAQKIGPAIIKKIKEKELPYYQLVLAATADPNNKKILATSSRQLWRPRFSPDAKLVAWVIDNVAGKTFEAGFDLYVAVISEKNPPIFVAPATTIGYDFRPDSHAIAYMKPEVENFDKDKSVLGSLVEQTIIDPNGKLLASPANPDGNTTPAPHICTGPAKEFAGILYCSWMYISYACDGRIFFSSSKMTLPSSKLDAEKQTIFCFDTLTGTVSEILPQIVVDFTQGNSNLFALSHDSRKILLHGKKNTLGIYAIGGDLNLSKPLIEENESFGDESPPKLVAQWKGRDQISCLVSEKSHFLTTDPNTPARRKEILILDTNGNLQQILSKDWPDELLDY
ncbi:MAG: hypothetical protein PHQ35_08595 [Phycisphaerae bacterium]|nr:hypothetical protein [Phycisphaerae bacterium]MDD5381548.1 hypothetical protein [Phycisphaerae bacterium]